MSKIVKKKHEILFNNEGCAVKDADGDIIAVGEHVNDMFRLKQVKKQQTNVVTEVKLEPWHKRLGHANIETVKKL